MGERRATSTPEGSQNPTQLSGATSPLFELLGGAEGDLHPRGLSKPGPAQCGNFAFAPTP